jgi:hypothetical protein
LAGQSFADSNSVRALMQEFQRNSDLNIKRAALRALGTYSSNPDVRRELINTVSDQTEIAFLRVEAALALAPLADTPDIKRALSDAHDRSRDVEFRAAISKTLYKAAANDVRIRQVMANNLFQFNDSRIKRASAWALMASSSDTQVRDALIRFTRDRFQEIGARIDAMKSLFAVRDQAQVNALLSDMAQDNFEHSDLRKTAIRMLLASGDNTRSRGTLLNLLGRSGDSGIRASAALGLKANLTEDDLRWLHAHIDPRTNQERDPFDGSELTSYTQF